MIFGNFGSFCKTFYSKSLISDNYLKWFYEASIITFLSKSGKSTTTITTTKPKHLKTLTNTDIKIPKLLGNRF